MKNNLITYQSKKSVQIYLNSGTADIFINGSMKSNIVFFFEHPLEINKNSYELRLSVVNAQFPISYYLINDTNNYIKINNTSYYFKKGNYNINTFITEWTNSIGPNWTLTYDNITNKISFAYTSNFTFSDNNNSLFPIIGFKKGTIYSSASNILVCPFCFNFAGLSRLNIKSSTFNLGNLDSYNKSKNRTIAVCPINSIGQGYILYHNYTHYTNIFKNYEISTIDISIQDDYKNYLDFNNIDWSLTLQIDILSEHIETIDNLADVYENLTQSL
jgi:hypothetical protein